MLTLFRAVIDRLKVMFASAAAAEFEAEFLARDAERRAELLRQAARYESEGLPTVATRLREQAEATATDQPGGSALPALNHWLGEGSVKRDEPVPLPAVEKSRRKSR